MGRYAASGFREQIGSLQTFDELIAFQENIRPIARGQILTPKSGVQICGGRNAKNNDACRKRVRRAIEADLAGRAAQLVAQGGASAKDLISGLRAAPSAPGVPSRLPAITFAALLIGAALYAYYG